jgi:hypothetical protein
MPYGKIQKTEFQTLSQSSDVFPIFQNSNPQSPNIKVAPKYPRNTMEKFEIKPKSFDMTWRRFCLSLNSADRTIFMPSYLLTQAISSLGTHTRQENLGTVKRHYTGSLARYASFGQPTSIWTRAESHFHVFDRVLKRSAAHWLPFVRAPRNGWLLSPRACAQPCPRVPISTPGAQRSALHSASRPEQELQLRRALPRPPSPSEPRPPRPAPSSHFQAAPVTRLASLVAREAFQVLGPGKASPETQDRPRRTSVACSRA